MSCVGLGVLALVTAAALSVGCHDDSGLPILVWSSNENGTFDVFRSDRDAFGFDDDFQITHNDQSDEVEPDITRDGRRIAFATNREGQWDIYTMDGTHERP